MQRGSENNNHETSPLRCCEINIPMDLTVEILKKLPTKSLMRFQCVSKQWSLVISSRRDFIDSIVARSLTQPLPRDTKFIFHHYLRAKKSSFFNFSSTYSDTIDSKSVSTIFSEYYQYVRGLIRFLSDSPFGLALALAIYNPTTRQYLPLPNFPTWRYTLKCLLGYDPLENRYKVLCIRGRVAQEETKKYPCQVFTLGDPRKSSGETLDLSIQFTLGFASTGLSITEQLVGNTYLLVSFDVRSEKFGHVEAPKTLIDHESTLINYQGKLGFICCQNGVEIWVMEDGVKKQGWSQIIHHEMEECEYWRIAGVTHGGEVVFVDWLLGFST